MTSSIFNDVFMQEALMMAQIAYQNSEIPVGAVIVDYNQKKIIARSCNLVQQYNNPTLHAEIIAINIACEALLSKTLSNCDIYISLEPCVMCAAAISYARIRRVFYATMDTKHGAVENGIRFFTQDSCYHRPEVYNDLSLENSKQLMQSFFRNIRKNSL